MTYDINNIWCYGCPENRQDLSYSAPDFKVTKNFAFMTKKSGIAERGGDLGLELKKKCKSKREGGGVNGFQPILE